MRDGVEGEAGILNITECGKVGSLVTQDKRSESLR